MACVEKAVKFGLAEMMTLFERLRTDRSPQDDNYDPPFSDFSVVIDNHGATINALFL